MQGRANALRCDSWRHPGTVRRADFQVCTVAGYESPGNDSGGHKHDEEENR
jgi:hypothetical protein